MGGKFNSIFTSLLRREIETLTKRLAALEATNADARLLQLEGKRDAQFFRISAGSDNASSSDGSSERSWHRA